MIAQSRLAAAVPGIIPGAAIRSATDAWRPTNLPPRRRVIEAELRYGGEDRFDWWRLTLACGHTVDCDESQLDDYWRCLDCFGEGAR